MLLLNFSHPLTSSHLASIEELLDGQTSRVSETREVLVRDVSVQADPEAPFAPQATALADATGLTPNQWQTEQILVNAPSYNFLTAALLAELHGRMGYFPPILRLRPVKDNLPPRFEVAEIINLQRIRDEARARSNTASPQPGRNLPPPVDG